MISNQALSGNFVAAAALMVSLPCFYWLSTLAAVKAGLSLSAEQMRELDAASATLRNDCRDRFKFDVLFVIWNRTRNYMPLSIPNSNRLSPPASASPMSISATPYRPPQIRLATIPSVAKQNHT